ncbi:uncharacterized protein LOC106756046 isoform X4 [Vigna radiata var. radiata]|uniref:Uncharacterized protein LOC106756046 isoform X4 n=1 Tax=Vigna radiata var. radiata TaxID=3916 RepID=A0A3Q0EU28_VIGRR|nr:uncharacterized protein LOC106756046 isoform X4 [Vigna radiata var. radiata]
MQTMRLMLSNSDNRSLIRLSSYLYSYFRTPLSFLSSASSRASSTATNLFTYPWSSSQRRGIKVSGSDIRVGNIIGKQGRIYEVLKVDHSHEGRGKATIKETCFAHIFCTLFKIFLNTKSTPWCTI